MRRVSLQLLHNTGSMRPRLIFAFAFSLTLHAALLAPDLGRRPAPVPIQVELRALRPALEQPELLLKNTIDSDEAKRIEAAPPPKPAPTTHSAPKREVQVAQRKLSQHLFYPADAVNQGIEGEVRLIVRVSADGAISDVKVGASSGHAILDNAAIRAAYAMGNLSAGEARELIVPVIFRLN
jgi:protein TonB